MTPENVHPTPVSPAAGRRRCRRRRQRGAFALVITLLILSLLIVVAVSYLSSMVSERQTADAYTSKARAEQVAQAGVDSAMAILTESFRDFPDSATAWDQHQSKNNDGSVDNEGTDLYLRAVPSGGTTGASVVANPQPNAASSTANDTQGNNPNNLTRENFVLPLVSGVPGGQAHLISQKGSILPTMNVSQSDPALQNFVDLNVRRASGDTQGVIGSPPGWSGSAPKPARAYWVKQTASNGLVTGRYAFWIEDESFRANSNFLGTSANPPDNSGRATVTGTTTPRSLQPSDLMLLGPLVQMGESDSDAQADANMIVNTRQIYPSKFFPDPLAFVHPAAPPSPSPTPYFSNQKADRIRYLTTTQSGTLNLTRHGTQRVNLNNVVATVGLGDTASINTQVQEIVQALKFHLPYFGERFYRLTTDMLPGTLNHSAQVPGSPKTDPNTITANDSEIYYYKVAANIRDYIDTDTQPTIVDNTGNVMAAAKPGNALNTSGSSTNDIWAQGKEISPYIQEAAVRMRPNVLPTTDANGAHPWTLKVDYYVEVWNMSDRDVYASPQTTDPTLPHLNGAILRITDQNVWELSPSPYGAVPTDDLNDPYRISTGGAQNDYEIDLTNGVRFNGVNGPLTSGGVVFKAGAMTVITTDPDCATYVFSPPHGQSPNSLSSVPTGVTPYASNPAVTYYCPTLLHGQRNYSGKIPKGYKGFQPQFRDQNYVYDYETEVTLCNGTGYLDSVPFAIDERTHTATWFSDTAADYHDYSYSSCLMGNLYDAGLHFAALSSQLGDPRTNNEQLSIKPYIQSGNGDQSHYIYGTGKDVSLGYYNPSQKPDAYSTTAYPWPDYYVLPTPQYPQVTATNPMNAVSAPMVVADGQLTSIGQLGDVFDPARLPGTLGAIALSRGGGRTFKIGQRDDRYCGDPTGNNTLNAVDAVPNSNAWSAWRLTDVFSIDNAIELPARININGVLRDNGAALLAALKGFSFQPVTTTTDPVIHGDNHNASASPAGASLNTSSTSNGFSQLISQMSARLGLTLPPAVVPPTAGTGLYVPSGPFFERGEFGELGASNTSIFGMSDPKGTSQGGSSTALLSGVDMYKAFDHSREELFRRISELICTRGDTFTVYTMGQSISQPTATAALKITGTHRMRVTFRLVPKTLSGYFHPSYDFDSNGQIKLNPATNLMANGRLDKPDHYDAQILSVNTY